MFFLDISITVIKLYSILYYLSYLNLYRLLKKLYEYKIKQEIMFVRSEKAYLVFSKLSWKFHI